MIQLRNILILLSFLFTMQPMQAATYVVTNTNDAGAGSLRQAILTANGTAASDIITFSIPGGGYNKINLVTILPLVSSPVRIDGWSQGGAGYMGPPLIEVSGVGITANSVGISLQGGTSEVRGMIVNGFQNGIVCRTNDWVYGNYIGTDRTGTTAIPNVNGINVNVGSGCIVGTNGDGVNDLAESNLVSGNSTNGIYVYYGSGNTIMGNLVGTDVTGTLALGNGQGIDLGASGTNIVGGVSASMRNVVSGNTTNGIILGGTGGTGNWIKGNYVGVDISGNNPLGNTQYGIYVVSGGTNNIIGSNGDGVNDALERNVVSCNYPLAATSASATNISINGTGTSNNIVAGNYIGITATGTAFPSTVNAGVRGIQITNSANNNTIGGITPETRNVIGGQLHYGLELAYTVTGTIITGNYIGTDPTGTIAIPNVNGGIQIYSSCTGNVVGTNGDGIKDALEGNLISGNGRGVRAIYASDNNIIAGNLIGTDPTGTIALPNTLSGVEIYNSNGTIIGGTAKTQRNIISGNLQYGITVYGTSTLTGIYNNYIGTDITGTLPVGNTWAGVNISSDTNFVGSGLANSGNLISGNLAQGVYLNGTGAVGNKVQGNMIGTDVTGKLNIGNTSYGIQITSGSFNIIGTELNGTNDATEKNIVSGNYWSGGSIGGSNANIRIDGATGSNNIISGNYIGTDITGKALIANAGVRGIQITGGTANLIGGSSVLERNIISGQKHYGIELVTVSGNRISGNYIGTDLSGTLKLGNTGGGIQLYVTCTNNIIGTNGDGVKDAQEGNLISGNGNGINIYYNCSLNTVAGNYFGTDVAGTTAIANNIGVVLYNSNQNSIGLSLANGRNIISGNTAQGIVIYGACSNNTVYNNYIGTQVNGISSLKNGADGILLQNTPSGNFIGGTGSLQPNIIAYNGGNGVNVTGGTGSLIRANSIFSNTKLGIDLNNNGVTQDDAGDADTGPNNLQNFPTVLLVNSAGGSTTVNGILHSLPNATYTVDFYDNTAYNPSGYGEGKTYLGSASVTTDNNGVISFTQTFPVASAAGIITLTATDALNNTSEFSGPFGDPLPVTLLQFDVYRQDAAIQVRWAVTEEVHVSRYEIEASENGVDFYTAGSVEAKGNGQSVYGYVLAQENYTGTVYFRLKAIDLDGAYTYSPLRSLNLSGNAGDVFAVYPNPSRGAFHLVSGTAAGTLRIYAADGRLVFVQELKGASSNGINTSLDPGLSKGVYMLVWVSESGLKSQSLIVE